MLKNFFSVIKKTNICSSITKKYFRTTNSLNSKHSIGEASVVIEERFSSNYKVNILNESGTVISIINGIARVFGLLKVQAGEIVEFSSGVKGMALNLETDNVGIVVLGNDREIKEGDIVKRMGSIIDMPIVEEMLGRTLDALGFLYNKKSNRWIRTN